MNILIFILAGIVAGSIMGLMGVGSGMIIVPALVYAAGFPQTTAVGTSIAVLLPPLGIAAVMEYYRNGYVDIKAAMTIAAVIIVSSWISSKFAVKINPDYLKIFFGSFIILLGIYMIITSARNILNVKI